MSDKVNHELEYRYPIDQTARIAALEQRSQDMSKTITIDNIKYTPSIIRRMEREAVRMYAQDQKHQMQIAQLEGEKRTLAARRAALEQQLATAQQAADNGNTQTARNGALTNRPCSSNAGRKNLRGRVFLFPQRSIISKTTNNSFTEWYEQWSKENLSAAPFPTLKEGMYAAWIQGQGDGETAMRERAAHVADQYHDRAIAKSIRALDAKGK